MSARGLLAWTVVGALAAGSPAPAQNHPELTWRTLESEHFRVLYHDGLELTARQAAEVAEAAYGPVTRLYGYRPSGPVRIILKDYDDYSNGAAFFYHDAIEVWITPLEHDYELRGTSDWLRNVITHELVHIVSLGAARKGPQRVPAAFLEYFAYKPESERDDILTGAPDRLALVPLANTVLPMWFAEGVAQHQMEEVRHDRWDSHRDMVLRTAVLDGTLLSLDDMGVFGKPGFENEFVYDHGYGLVRYLAATYGDSSLAEICDQMGRWTATDIDGPLHAVTGRSADQVWHDWRDSMVARYETQVAALGELREGERLTGKGHSNTRAVYAPDGARLAYLSTLGRRYGPHFLVLRDLDSGEDEVVAGGVASVPDWFPDGERLLFVRKEKADRYGSRRADLFEHDLTGPERSWPGRLLWTLPALTGVYAPKDPRTLRMSRGLRALYPAVSPDGQRIAFVRLGPAGAALGLADRDGSGVRYLLEFDDGTQLYTPRWSPDGRWLALSYGSGGSRDIALVDPNGEEPAPPRLQPLIASAGTDRDPSWSPGGELLFVSDVSGIFNVYARDPASGAVEQVTNVRGGAFFPTANAAGDVVYSGYGGDGFHLYRIERSGAEPVDSAIFTPPAAVAAAPGLPSLPAPESPLAVARSSGTEILRTTVMPRLTHDEGYAKVGAYVATGDALDRQSIFGSLSVAPGNGDRDIYGEYRFRGFRPTVRLSFIHLKRHSARGDSSEARDFFIRGMNFSLNRLTLGARGQLNRASSLALSLAYDRYDASLENDQLHPRRDGRPGFERVPGKPVGYTYLHGFDLALTYRHDSLPRRVDREINPRGGRRLYLRYDRMHNWFIEGFDEENISFLQEEYKRLFYNQLTLDWREYLALPGDTALGLRAYGGWIFSDSVDDELVGGFFDFHLGGLPYMRGYTYYSIEGRKAAMANATFRFPLLPRLRQRLGPLYLHRVHGAVYGDLGKAWDGDLGGPDPMYGREGPLRDAGLQLRVDGVSFYSLPTRLEIDLAYGIDEVEEKEPWKLYLTLLFNYLNWFDSGSDFTR